MLEKLLKLIDSEDVHSYADLAREMKVSLSSDGTAPLLDQMLTDLTRMGYLSVTDSTCAEHCSTCAMSGVCGIGAGNRIWTVTDKGHNLVK